ncbi:MAG: ComEC/Rec2 family competence protein [Paenibacillus sp.]|uniref:ComEC/Rec2 family competence protein n=1 Tax=Paenibacillus sp. TaxID=58172 RepID=UPI0029131343|nr:ComEC/Rec2 family competence protein [Paenibacillus sp.]MDU4697323.1 ComEC/Rec2 family competence protein [Paenibacillus sp.]
MSRQKTRWTVVCVFALWLSVLLSGCAPGSWEEAVGRLTENTPPASEGMGDRSLRVIFLDVGQGASQLLISPSGHTMLIDAGNNDKEEEMVRYLQAYGVHRLDLVIGTHPDADHIGGLDRVIDRLDIGEIYMPKIQSNTKTFESLLNSIRSKGLKVKTAKAGVELAWDEEVQVNLFAPVKATDDNNNMSAVVKVTYGNTSFLLTGDAESESERLMLDSGANLRADVLLVGHHGSKSSTTAKFLSAVKPKYAVIQVGDNSYGHPTKTILDRLAKQQVQVYRNDLQGTVEIISNGEGYHITTER